MAGKSKKYIWDNKKLSKALGQEIGFDFKSSNITTDSRKIAKGDIFIALKGENFDGNKFAGEAIKKGAVAAVVDNPKIRNPKFINVEDGLQALQQIGRFRRRNSSAKFIAVTGSVGKTSAKEMIHAVLSSKYETCKTEGNLNNHIGLPLTLANMPMGIDYAVIELGMNHKGEISDLVRICTPDISTITWVSEAHIENLGSVENIARAKAEVFEWMGNDSTAVIPADNEFYSLLRKLAENNGVTNLYAFGEKVNSVKKQKKNITATIKGKKISFDNSLLDTQVLNNILLALTFADICKVPLKQAINAILKMKQLKGRGGKIELKSGATLIDDSYNASPTSMKNALVKFSSFKAKRKIAALGDMRELGSFSRKYHEDLATDLKNIDMLITCGKDMKFLNLATKGKITKKHFSDIDSAYKFLKAEAKKGDAILIKGSHGSNMWKLVDMLKA